MIKKCYTTLFFDLDNTLFDFSLAENRAIKRTLLINGLPNDEETARLYSEINRSYWEKYERNEIKKQEIFDGRFRTLFEKIGVTADTEKISKDYFAQLSAGHDLIEGANEILKSLKDKNYFICATTNGVSMTQHRRIKDSGIKEFFDVICVSEDAGCQKPDKEYFDFVISKCPKKDKEKMLIIGDSQSSDILGGINAGIDTCWFNPSGNKAKYKPTYEIKTLSELHNIL